MLKFPFLPCCERLSCFKACYGAERETRTVRLSQETLVLVSWITTRGCY